MFLELDKMRGEIFIFVQK